MDYQQKPKIQPGEFIAYWEDDAKILRSRIIGKSVSRYQKPILILKSNPVSGIMADYVREKCILCQLRL